MSRTKGITHPHEISAEGEGRTYEALAHVPAGEGTSSLRVFAELVTHKIPSWRTGGAYSLFEVTTQPGAGPPPHVNHREDESFYVLEGEYVFLIEGRAIRARAGSLLYFPKGTLHAHRGVGEGVGRMLATQTPGASTSASSRRWVGRWKARRAADSSRDSQMRRVSSPRRPSTASRYRRPSRRRPNQTTR